MNAIELRVAFRQPLERRQCLIADMMFDPLSVGLGVGVADPNRAKELDHDPMSPLDGFGELPAALCQEDRTIRLAVDQPLDAKSRDGFYDRDVRDAEPPGDVDRSGLAAFVDQVGDDFDVIFSDFAAVRLAGVGMTPGLILRDRQDCALRRAGVTRPLSNVRVARTHVCDIIGHNLFSASAQTI